MSTRWTAFFNTFTASQACLGCFFQQVGRVQPIEKSMVFRVTENASRLRYVLKPSALADIPAGKIPDRVFSRYFSKERNMENIEKLSRLLTEADAIRIDDGCLLED